MDDHGITWHVLTFFIFFECWVVQTSGRDPNPWPGKTNIHKHADSVSSSQWDGTIHDHPMIEICLADWAPRAPGCRNRCFGRHGGIVAIWRPPKSGKSLRSLREGDQTKCDMYMYDLYVTTIMYYVLLCHKLYWYWYRLYIWYNVYIHMDYIKKERCSQSGHIAYWFHKSSSEILELAPRWQHAAPKNPVEEVSSWAFQCFN